MSPRGPEGAPAEAPAEAPGGGESRGWRDVEEKGNGAGIAALVVVATTLGRWPARRLVEMIAFYYALFSPRTRHVVRDFLARVGEPVGFFRVYRQVLRFAQTALDGLFLVRGKIGAFTVDRDGTHHLDALRREGKGAILLGAHVGSFYAMRAQGREAAFPLHPLVYTKNAKKLNDAFKRLDPKSSVELIEMSEGVGFMLEVRDRVEHGGLIAILADRLPPSTDEGARARGPGQGAGSVVVDFLGGKARVPTGPYVLAATLRCPVYFVAGIYRAPSRYELHCIPFADRVVLPRGRREEAVAEYAQRYADQLAEFVRSAPDNWFNFYDFWEDGKSAR